MTLKRSVLLGQTPDYLDPESQEALHEVDISGLAIDDSFDQPHRRTSRGTSEEGACSDRVTTEQAVNDDIHETRVQRAQPARWHPHLG